MKRLQIVFWLIALLALVQIVAGIWIAGSVAAAADGLHSLFDVAGITIALYVTKLGRSRTPTAKKLLEAEGGKAIAVVILCTAAVLVTIGIYRIFTRIQVEHPFLMLTLGGMGVAVNSLALYLLHKRRNEGSHLYGAYLHRAGDFFSSAIVMIGAGAIIIAETYWAVNIHFLDSAMTFIIALFLVALARRVLRQ